MVTPRSNFRVTSDLNSFGVSCTVLKGLGPFQHRGSAGSDTCLSDDLLREAFSCSTHVMNTMSTVSNNRGTWRLIMNYDY